MTANNANARIAGLEPSRVWTIFADIAAVPRPSKHEERIRAHVREFAKKHELPVREDQTGNLVISVPASPGHEDAPITVLQGHLDMVCEKNSGTNHDFEKEGIHLRIAEEESTRERIVRGSGTTLGADNGIGVSLALAAATDPDVVHGPLELLFTIDEEDGMTGAKALTPESFRGRRMINLDSEEDDALYIGCAGGTDSNLAWSMAVAPVSDNMDVCEVKVGGLRGGHSGGDIHEGRANAIKLVARVLGRVASEEMRLVRIDGGSKRNAIPREAAATVAGPKGLTDQLHKAATELAAEAKAESFEPVVTIEVCPARGHGHSAAHAGDTLRLLAGLAALPSGVLGMHPQIPALVETSNNLSTIETKTNGSQIMVSAGLLSRSSSASRMRELVDQLAAIGRFCGATVTTGNAYPGWDPNPDSPTLAVARRVYQALFKKDPKVLAIHAGLECGIIGKLVGNMDMVSLGPTIRGAHSPDERVYIDSVARVWKYLTKLLAELAE